MPDSASYFYHQHHLLSDQELLLRFYQDLDNQWLSILLPRYTLLLLGLSMKYLKNEEDARDAVQQTFEKVLAELPRHKVTYFRSWLYIVAKNVCLQRLRHQGAVFSELEEELQESLAAQDTDESYRKEMTLQALEELVVQLPAEQRQCIELFYLNNHSYQQVAERTGFTPGQVKSYIQNGKRNLRIALLKKQGGTV